MAKTKTMVYVLKSDAPVGNTNLSAISSFVIKQTPKGRGRPGSNWWKLSNGDWAYREQPATKN